MTGVSACFRPDQSWCDWRLGPGTTNRSQRRPKPAEIRPAVAQIFPLSCVASLERCPTSPFETRLVGRQSGPSYRFLSMPLGIGWLGCNEKTKNWQEDRFAQYSKTELSGSPVNRHPLGTALLVDVDMKSIENRIWTSKPLNRTRRNRRNMNVTL